MEIYKDITFEVKSTAHDLLDNELMAPDDILDNSNLRWMVFKIKQKSQVEYYDQVVPQLGANANAVLATDISRINSRQSEVANNYNIAYNRPYDYLSFVEMVKFDAQVMYKKDEGENEKTTVTTEEAEAIAAIKVIAGQTG